jgi:hypothetical protein
VLLVPLKASTWPEGFFENIRIEDANFTRPDQGELPAIVEFTRWFTFFICNSAAKPLPST